MRQSIKEMILEQSTDKLHIQNLREAQAHDASEEFRIIGERNKEEIGHASWHRITSV